MKVIFRNTNLEFEMREKTWQLVTIDADGIIVSNNPAISQAVESGYKTISSPMFPMSFDKTYKLKIQSSNPTTKDVTIRILNELSTAMKAYNMTFVSGNAEQEFLFTIPYTEESRAKKFQLIIDAADSGLDWTLGVYELK